MKQKFAFLSSVRFWKLVIIAIVGVLVNQGIVSLEIATAINTLLLGDIAINTIDRFSTKK